MFIPSPFHCVCVRVCVCGRVQVVVGEQYHPCLQVFRQGLLLNTGLILFTPLLSVCPLCSLKDSDFWNFPPTTIAHRVLLNKLKLMEIVEKQLQISRCRRHNGRWICKVPSFSLCLHTEVYQGACRIMDPTWVVSKGLQLVRYYVANNAACLGTVIAWKSASLGCTQKVTLIKQCKRVIWFIITWVYLQFPISYDGIVLNCWDLRT